MRTLFQLIFSSLLLLEILPKPTELFVVKDEYRDLSPEMLEELIYKTKRESNLIEKHQTHLARGERENAETIEAFVDQELDAAPSDLSLQYVKAKFLAGQQRYNEALSILRGVCDESKYKIDYYVVDLASALLNTSSASNYDEAILVLRKGVTVLNKSYTIHSMLVNTLVRLERLDEAFSALGVLLWIFPEKYEIWLTYCSHFVLHSDRQFKTSPVLSQMHLEDVPSMTEFDYIHSLLSFGLTIFPRSPEILYAAAMNFCLSYQFHFDKTNVQSNRRSLECALLSFQKTADIVRHRTESSISIDSKFVSYAVVNGDILQGILTEKFSTSSVSETFSSCFPTAEPVGQEKESKHPVWLHVGCSSTSTCPKVGWTVVDIQETPVVHFVSPAYDLHMFSDGHADKVYSSHTLEHMSWAANVTLGTGVIYPEICAAVSEWSRVLTPGGELFVSVPDIEILSEMMSRNDSTVQRKNLLLPIIFGGQDHESNFHKMGFYYDYLKELLVAFDMCEIKRVDGFGFFLDTSEMKIDLGNGHEPFSLNVRARKCLPGESTHILAGCPCFLNDSCFQIAYSA